MGLYARERALIYQLLHWVFVPIINEVSNVLTNGNNDGYGMFTRDSQHFPTPTSACTIHNVYIQQGSSDTYPKYFIHERSDWIHLSLCNILQHLIFNFWVIHPFQFFDSSLCFTSIEANLDMCSNKKIQKV